MTKTEYKLARISLGVTTRDWLKLINISESSHESALCGRRKVPAMAAAHVRTLLLVKELDARVYEQMIKSGTSNVK